MEKRSPQKFGDYYLMDKIAVGGMAEIWRAKTVGLEGFERVVAIKFILSNYTQNPEFNSMFIDEARIASTLNHSNIVRITNFGVIEGRYYHEMEFIDGKNVRQIFQKSKEEDKIFPLDSACYLMSEVCKGLHYVHTKHDPFTNEPLNIIHRDVSPQNIIVSYEGEVKILDWGIAKAKGKVDETRAGILKGKFGYMSPEQAEGEELDARTDIFSTGVVFYELITGERLFVADNEINTLKKIKECNVPAPSKVNPLIDAELEAIVMKALARYRIERYQNCYDMHEDLIRYLHKRFPANTSMKLSRSIKELFTKEIIEERKRMSEMEHSVPSYSSFGYSSGSYEEKTRLSSGQPQENQNTSMDRGVSDRDKTQLTDGSSSRRVKKENTSTDARTVVDPSYSDSKAYEAPKQEYFDKKAEPEKPRPLSIYGSGRKRLIIRGAILVGALILVLMVLFSGGETKDKTKDTAKNTERTVPDFIEFPETKTENTTEPTSTPQTQTPVQPQEEPAPTSEPVKEPTPVQEPTPSIINTKASLMVTSTPESSLYIDGEYKGKTPLDLRELDINRKYQIELKLDGYNTISKFFTLRKAGSNRLDFGLSPQVSSDKSHLSLEIQPPVKIYIDGVLVSNFRSLYMYEIQPGDHTVRLLNDKAGIDTTIQVNVPKGEHVKKDITLR